MLKNCQDEGKTPVLVAHQGYKFDFPVLANALKSHNLLTEFQDLDALHLDSLVFLRKHSTREDSPIYQCKAKNISALRKFLFGTDFSAHDAQEVVKALIAILFQSTISVKQSEIFTIAN